MMKRLFPVVLMLLVLALPARADERILSFDSVIEVFTDGSMQVTETIVVSTEQKQIKRGIYRDFPTDYRDRFGNRVEVEFDVIDVRRDGQSESWHQAREGNGVRVYIGRKEHTLPRSTYRYELTYRTDRQLGFFDDHDELYWNVTGNDWAFPIDAATARVLLPSTIPPATLKPEAYTGARGAKGEDYRSEIGADGAVLFSTTRPFSIGEGLTIVVVWPKGYVTPPSTERQIGWLLHDNRSWLIGLAGLCLLLIYYLLAWRVVGRDPEAGVIIVRYAPPPGVTPAAARFIARMGYDHKTFAAAIVNLAVKGLLEIREQGGEFTLTRSQQPATGLAAGENAIISTFFGNRVGGSITLKQTLHATIGKAVKAHEAALKRNHEKIYFVTNRGWLVPGILLTLLVLGLTVVAIGDPEKLAIGGFLSLWLTGWSVGVYALGSKTIAAWRATTSFFSAIGALFLTAFAVPFVAAEVFVIGILGTEVSPALPAVLVTSIAFNLLFYQLLKAPTRAGRRLLDELDGFREYLEVAEADEMNFRNPPEKTPQLFEQFLPYALALGVEQRWMERFAGLFLHLQNQDEGYQPAWYHGRHWDVHQLSSFSGVLGGALASAVAASSTAPGSSSGSGGGGSSGGGGGGGGGGGW
jgi:uncharacterized membrane protein YgcG